ncbi:MAG: NADH-quinone oxidoreductase subunit C [Anaerolineaceae bacterium]|nr:NADH-quinone oxidoreductase subunit C [Anaerolineaceae bacterium]
MEEPLSTLVKKFQQDYKVEVRTYVNETSLLLKKDFLLPAVQQLKNEYHFNMLIDISAVDYWPQDNPRVHVIYQFYALEDNQLLRLRVPLKNKNLSIASIVSLFSGANWYEREVFDLFGIQFENHPDMRRIIMPYDWVGHPLRKDYPLGYEEVQFTFNYDEIDLRKPYAKE